MSIRRIKAHTAEEEGSYIKIVKYSRRGSGLIIGTIIGFFGSLVLLAMSDAAFSPEANFFIVVAASIMCAIYGASVAGGREERQVPKADLVEIKRYIWPERVTVVLDDERGKTPKPPAQKPKTEAQ